MLLIAALAGFGGGNFASSMTNISWFYPEKEKGWALGLNAAGGNIGVAVVQAPFVVAAVVTAGAGIHLGARRAPVHPARRCSPPFCAWRYMDNLSVAKADFASSAARREAAAHLGDVVPLHRHLRLVHRVRRRVPAADQGSVPRRQRDRRTRSSAPWSARWSGRSAAGSPTASAAPGSPRSASSRWRRGRARRSSWSLSRQSFGALLRRVHAALRRDRRRQRLDLPDDPRDLPPRGRRRRRRRGDAKRAPGGRRRSASSPRSAPTAASWSRAPTAGRRERSGRSCPRSTSTSALYAVMLAVTWAFYLRRGAAMARRSLTEPDLDAGSVDTHCPYCALQCAMRLDAVGGRRASRSSPRGLPDQPRRPVPEGLDVRGAAHRPGPAHHAAGARRGRRAARRRPGTRRSTSSPARLARSRRAHGRDAVGGLRRRRADQREGLPAGQVRPGGAAAPAHRLQRPLLHVLRRGRRQPRLRHRPRAALPARPTSAAPDAVLLLGSNVADTMPPLRPAPRRRARARRPGRRRPAAHRDRRADATTAAGCTCSRCPGTDLSLLLGLLHLRRRADGSTDGSTSRAARPAATTYAARSPPGGRERVAPVTGVPEPHLRARRRACSRTPPRAAAARARSCSPAAAPSSTPTAPTPSPPRSTWRSRSGLPGRAGSGYGCLTGQGNGQGGREHGQKSDQLPGLPQASTTPRPARTSPRCGASTPTRCPARACPRSSCSARSAARCGRCSCTAATRWSAPRTPTRVRDRLAALDLLVVCDFVPSETAALADVVLPVTQWAEEEGTMTSLEGRVLRRRKAVDAARRRPQRAEVLADLAARLGCPVAFPTDARDGLRRARARRSAGGRADYAGLSHALLDAERGRTGTGRPQRPTRDAAAVRRRLRPPPTAGRGSSRSTPAGRPTTCARTRRSTSSPDGCSRSTSPARRPAASPALTAAAPESVRRAAPPPGRAARHARRRARAGHLGPRHGDGAGPGHHRRSAPTPSSCRSTGPGGRPTPSPTTPPTRSAACRSSRCARSSGRATVADDGSMEARGMSTRGQTGRRGRRRHGGPPVRRGAGGARPRRPVRRHAGRRRGVRAVQPDPAHRGASPEARRPGSSLTLPRPHRAGRGAARGAPRSAIDREARIVDARRRRPRCRYDQLVLATGARAFVPPRRRASTGDEAAAPRARAPRHRRRAAARRRAANARHAVVLGGGLLGLEAACGLAPPRRRRHGRAPDRPHLMDGQLDADRPRVLAGAARRPRHPRAHRRRASPRCSPRTASCVARPAHRRRRHVAPTCCRRRCGIRADTGARAATPGSPSSAASWSDDDLASPTDAAVHAIGDCAAAARAAAPGWSRPGWDAGASAWRRASTAAPRRAARRPVVAHGSDVSAQGGRRRPRRARGAAARRDADDRVISVSRPAGAAARRGRGARRARSSAPPCSVRAERRGRRSSCLDARAPRAGGPAALCSPPEHRARDAEPSPMRMPGDDHGLPLQRRHQERHRRRLGGRGRAWRRSPRAPAPPPAAAAARESSAASSTGCRSAGADRTSTGHRVRARGARAVARP